MNGFANTVPEASGERRCEKRVSYTAVLSFKEYNGRTVPVEAPKPNATALNLSLAGICFVSKRRPKSEFLVLYLPDGSRAIVRVASTRPHDDLAQHRIHCEVLKWLAKDAKTPRNQDAKILTR